MALKQGENHWPSEIPNYAQPLLQMLGIFPGLTPEQAQKHISTPLSEILETGLIQTQISALGMLITTGPATRFLKGLKPYYTSPAHVLEDGSYLYSAAQKLIMEQDMHLSDKPFRNLIALYNASGDPVYLAGRARGIRARTLKRILSTHAVMLTREKGTLIVAHPDPRYLRFIVAKDPRVQSFQLKPAWVTPTRQRAIPTAFSTRGTSLSDALPEQPTNNPSESERNP